MTRQEIVDEFRVFVECDVPFENAQEMLAKIRAWAVNDDWKPIESCPVGPRILTWHVDGFAMVSRFSEEMKWAMKNYTHWRPLPPGPKP